MRGWLQQNFRPSADDRNCGWVDLKSCGHGLMLVGSQSVQLTFSNSLKIWCDGKHTLALVKKGVHSASVDYD